jgi:predicted nucleotidyltransferase
LRTVLIMSTIDLIMSTSILALGDLIFGQTRGSILALLYGHPDERFFTREIARHSGASVGSVKRELETLSRFGLVDRSMLGRQVYYQANREHPVFPETRSLVAKTVGVFQLLGSALAPLAGRVSLAFVYGSTARGNEKAGSDVDLMIVGDVTLDEVLTQVGTVEGAIGRQINPTVYSAEEFKRKLENGNHFLRSVVRGEVVCLTGDLDEFRKMG